MTVAPEPPGRTSILGVEVDRLSRAEALARVTELVERPTPALVAFANAHALNVAARQPRFAAVLARADLVLNDGSGLAIAGRLVGRPFPENLNGSDFVPAVVELAARSGWRVYLLGALPGVAAAAADVFRAQAPGLVVCGVHDGHFPDEASAAVAAEVRTARADVLLVAMGNPRQELWLADWLGETGASIGFGVGALFDFQSGRVRRAPAWMNRAGVEWAFRLAQEPRRLARRYLVGNPLFLARVAASLARRPLGRGRRA